MQAAPATAWRATGSFPADMSLTVISIHALREEGDRWAVIEMVASYDFYPRPPRGGRPQTATILGTLIEFLSTPSARRATSGTSLKIAGA